MGNLKENYRWVIAEILQDLEGMAHIVFFLWNWWNKANRDSTHLIMYIREKEHATMEDIVSLIQKQSLLKDRYKTKMLSLFWKTGWMAFDKREKPGR